MNKGGQDHPDTILSATSSPSKKLKVVGNDSTCAKSSESVHTTLNFDNVKEAEPFQDLLRCIRAKEDWKWSGRCVEDLACLLALKRLAQKLSVENLESEIQEYLDWILDPKSGILNPETACRVFQEARVCGVSDLKDRALEIILKSPSIAFGSPQNFRFLSSESFREILSKDELEVSSELELFHIVLQWGRSKFQSTSQAEDDRSLKVVVADIIPTIRFTQMTLQEFMDHVYPTELLSDTLLAKILPILHKKDKQGSEGAAFATLENPRKYWDPFGKLPVEMFCEILKRLDNKGLRSCRNVSSRFQNIIDEKFSLEITLTDSTLQKIGWLAPNSHSFTRITFHSNEFGDVQKNQLLNFLFACKQWGYKQIVMDLQIHLVPCHQTLMTLLERTSELNLKILLRVQRISTSFSYEGYTATLPFCQLESIHFESILYSTEVRCLIDIVKNSPNLKQIVVGDFTLRPKDCINAQFSKFLQSVNLKDVEISCGNLELKMDLNIELFRQLKNQNVRFKKIYFHDEWHIDNLEFIDIYRHDLEEIYGLHVHTMTAPSLARSLPALKTLCVACDPKWLIGILDKLPNMVKLIWSYFSWENGQEESVTSLSKESLKYLPNLTKFNIKIYRDGDLNGIKLLAPSIPNIKSFKCFNGCGSPISLIYDFTQLEELQLIQEGGFSIQDMTGLKDSSEAPLFNEMETCQRPPYIGHLKQLKILNFGLLDYQSESWSWRWKLEMEALEHGIGHLKNLNEIIFPPMKTVLAKSVLAFISKRMKQVEMVKLQVWKGNSIAKGTTTKSDVDNFRIKYANSFQVKSIEVFEQDGVRHPVFM